MAIIGPDPDKLWAEEIIVGYRKPQKLAVLIRQAIERVESNKARTK